MFWPTLADILFVQNMWSTVEATNDNKLADIIKQ